MSETFRTEGLTVEQVRDIVRQELERAELSSRQESQVMTMILSNQPGGSGS